MADAIKYFANTCITCNNHLVKICSRWMRERRDKEGDRERGERNADRHTHTKQQRKRQEERERQGDKDENWMLTGVLGGATL